uniref:Acetyl-coenzyme A carboxylase carboxyl transferase subunit beta, chloroplastic n=1 Tax=Aristolochia kwangsiensis TaxID=158552 RepID=A0A7G9TZD3_9MAGN|nr:acetyl-CoA carboxylase beta subunit [Aristolochia kwangsiensis]QNN85759.1 acetyl-CoA carboxylase beta subunit [Aristolochia kwangsiensis]WHE25979.1 acetyl-CoA carboxylase subunit beta [Aristolochia kwangsiensis]
MTIHLLYFHSNRGQEGSMEKWWFNSMLSNGELEHWRGLSKSRGSLGHPIGNTNGSEDPIINDTDKNIHSWSDSGILSSSHVDHLFGARDIWSFISDDTFLVRDSNGDSYSIYFDIENLIFEIDNESSFLSELESYFSSYLNSGTKNDNRDYDCYMYDTKYDWNNHINSCIDSYLRSDISIDSYISSGNDNDSDSDIYGYIFSESLSGNDSESSSIRTGGNDSDFNIRGRSNDFDINQKYKHLWVQCENCYGLNYKKFFRSKMNICEQCGYHLKMGSSDRIELLIDPGTWEPMDEDMVSIDPIEFHSEEEPYKDRIDSYQRKTGLTEAVQTGIGQLNGIPIAIGVMDFHFMGGSMGSVVGEKITRLIEYATNRSLPVIMVCASGGARMQEGSLSLMQMAKISSASYDYQSTRKLFYVSILTSPTTGGVTASFGMLGDIIIAEPNAYIAFAGKRVIEQTLNKTVPDGSQGAEYLFSKGLFDLIVPRNPLKGVLSELFQLHGFFPLNQNSKH